jgi:hypothetical protein
MALMVDEKGPAVDKEHRHKWQVIVLLSGEPAPSERLTTKVRPERETKATIRETMPASRN